MLHIENIKSSQILSCFCTNKLACYSFIDARRHNPPGLETKDFIIHAMSFNFKLLLLSLRPTGVDEEVNPSRDAAHAHMTGFCHSWRIQVLGDSQSRKVLLANLPNLCFRRWHCFYCNDQEAYLFSFLEGDIIFISWGGCLLYKHS